MGAVGERVVQIKRRVSDDMTEVILEQRFPLTRHGLYSSTPERIAAEEQRSDTLRRVADELFNLILLEGSQINTFLVEKFIADLRALGEVNT